MLNNFIKCGITGWCMEVVWTGLMSFKNKDSKLTCNTSIWMFPIYGLASFIKPISRLFSNKNFLVRGLIYAGSIFSIEYATGNFLKSKNMCPWDYSKCKHQLNGLIRYDYAILWFIVGLFYETILNEDTDNSHS